MLYFDSRVYLVLCGLVYNLLFPVWRLVTAMALMTLPSPPCIGDSLAATEKMFSLRRSHSGPVDESNKPRLVPPGRNSIL